MKINLIGRPNVGKSSLFNKLCGKHISIVDDQIGTTIDYNEVCLGKHILCDTVGLYDLKNIEDYALKNPKSIVLQVIDELTDFDRMINKVLAKQKVEVWLIVNKCDIHKIEEKYNLIYKKIFHTSVMQNIGINELNDALDLDAIHKNLPVIAILGKCNTGKSTLLNALANMERVKVCDEIGTTRDSIIINHEKFAFMDTAGYKKNNNKLERIIANRRLYALQEAIGAIIVFDNTFTLYDKKMLSEAHKFNFVIAVINKSDLQKTKYELPWPTIPISAKEGKLDNLLPLIERTYKRTYQKLSTNILTNWIHNTTLNIKFLRQDSLLPMIFKYDRRERLSFSEERYLIRLLRAKFDLGGVTIFLRHIH